MRASDPSGWQLAEIVFAHISSSANAGNALFYWPSSVSNVTSRSYFSQPLSSGGSHKAPVAVRTLSGGFGNAFNE